MLRAERQAKARARYARCVAQRNACPYHVAVMNNGAHWRVQVAGEAFDFWPHTGTWMNPRNHEQRGKAEDFDAFFAAIQSRRAA